MGTGWWWGRGDSEMNGGGRKGQRSHSLEEMPLSTAVWQKEVTGPLSVPHPRPQVSLLPRTPGLTPPFSRAPTPPPACPLPSGRPSLCPCIPCGEGLARCPACVCGPVGRGSRGAAGPPPAPAPRSPAPRPRRAAALRGDPGGLQRAHALRQAGGPEPARGRAAQQAQERRAGLLQGREPAAAGAPGDVAGPHGPHVPAPRHPFQKWPEA